jgi:heme o synthase
MEAGNGKYTEVPRLRSGRLLCTTRPMWKAYSSLTKAGIIVFSLLAALAGYAVSFDVHDMHSQFDWLQPVMLMVGLYFVAAGSFAINQAQEWKIDKRMKRTENRPIPRGLISPFQAYALGLIYVPFGLLLLCTLGALPAYLALLTVILYNGVYTMWWKKHMAFGAVPGAIPGAMPVVIGYSVNSSHIFQPDSVYLFLILFLWQMPHFWALAIRYREDYASGGIPVLPVRLGVSKTLYHMGLYTLAYVGVAMTAPWFLKANFFYLIFVVPISIKVMWEFTKYFRDQAQTSWLPFFLWTNLSLIVYLAVPVVDKWIYWVTSYNV